MRPAWPNLKQPSNKRPRKSDQEDQTSSEEACKAKLEAPLELGAKMSDVLEESKMDLSVNQYTSVPNPELRKA